MSASPEQPIFGRLLTAMITPFGPDGKVNLTEAARLAQHLVDNQGHDGLVINGTTGESPTTSDEEKRELLGTVIEAVGDRASVVAGVGTFDTHHTIELSRQAAEAGADGLLVVTPYYSRPPVDALEEHFLAVADASELPIMLYDIPHRAGIPIPETSLIRLAGHPRIAAVKDAKGDICSSSMVIANSTLTYYAGDDAYLLPLLAVGGAGVVGTSTHFSGLQVRALLDAFVARDLEQARQLNAQLLPVFRGVFATQGTMMVKAALNRCGFDVGMCRPPMGKVAPELLERFLEILDAQL
ncbi:MAG: 4-hydroxy-tetrahydrodipicolinate synthase [Propionibacterium sp.]|jgi:dihydrodipicolinate synthase|nr:4-hydroxy-tetrahydrodipicolinate synthase [Propionibacterium sp.]